MSSFLQRLKQRKITQWAIAYLAGAWLFLEVLGFIATYFGWQNVIVQAAMVTLAMGLLAVLVLAWFHGEKGHQRLRLAEGLMLSGIVLTTVALLFTLPEWAPAGAPGPASPTPATDRSIAVLPFVNASEDPEQQYFSDGVSDEIINALARLPGLHVAARNSSFQFAGSLDDMDLSDIAGQLGVATLVHGSVRRAGDTVRVTARLINARNGLQMWSESFDRELTGIFAIQDEIATAIATALHVQLVMEGVIEPSVPRAASIDAYNLYLLGRFHFEKRTNFELGQAQHYFENAIQRDPLYAPAYSGLVDAIMLRSDYGYGDVPIEESIAAALPLIDRALKLAPAAAETHASLGLLRMMERDLLASEAALLRAIELSPSMSRAYLWLYISYQQSRQEKKAFEMLQRTFSLDPLMPIVSTNMAAEWWARGNNVEALRAAKRAIQIAPDAPLGYRLAARIQRTSGELAEAVKWLRQALEVAPEDPLSQLDLGTLLVDLGLYEEAESLLGNHRYVAFMAQGRIEEALAVVQSSLGDRPEDFRTTIAAARTQSRAGNFEQVRLLLEPLLDVADGDNGPLFAPYSLHFWDPQIAALDLVVARVESGDREAGMELLAAVREHFAFLQDEGLGNPMLSYQEARILALEGKLDDALDVLRTVIGAGWRCWYLDGDPALRNLQDKREFQSIIADRDRLAGQQRDLLVER